ncbi:hypothetical protein ACIQXV_20700 [Neobacillus sp. NPDC097160]|uniref:hypothetical protein n=1 Tax=Neobacillus sp. NPDC097160 TaxID=3364298 RepID=UPI0038055F6B
MKQIQGITAEGVRYISESGKPRFIDFKKCNQNWIKYKSRTENLMNDELQEISEEGTIQGLVKSIEEDIVVISALTNDGVLDGEHM